MRIVPSLVAATLCLACSRKEDQPLPKPPAAKAPVRGAAGDEDLRVMLSEVASSKACDMIRDSFRGLKGTADPNVITGVLWTRDCKITNDGTRVTFELGGQGWQWADQTKKKAGAKFQLREYIKFGVKAVLRGALDIAYDQNDHIVSLWFSPSTTPEVHFEPIGDVQVDEKGTWSSIVGGLSSMFGSSPDEQGSKEAKKQGTHEFESQMADGLTVAIDLCTGYQRFTMGRPPKGQLGPPNPGETRKVPIEISPGGLLVFGPFQTPDGMHIDMTSDGPLRVGLACAKDAEPAVDAFIAEKPLPEIETLAKTDVTGSGTLEIKPQHCKVVLAVKSLAKDKVRFQWSRPATEIARSTGGPAIHCARKTTLSSEGHGSGSGAPATAAARRR